MSAAVSYRQLALDFGEPRSVTPRLCVCRKPKPSRETATTFAGPDASIVEELLVAVVCDRCNELIEPWHHATAAEVATLTTESL